MKKSMLFMVFICLAAFPSFSQEEKNITLPTIEIRVSPDLVPPVVKDAVVKDFGEGHKPIVWATTSSKFNTYGWEQSVDVATQDINYYAVHTQTTTGSALEAVYTPDGKLVRSKEEVKNFEPPQAILASIQKSNYKDWTIAKDVLMIKVYQGGVPKEHYEFKMIKGKQKKSLYFDKDGNMMMNKRK
jgi:hypothetical protein